MFERSKWQQSQDAKRAADEVARVRASYHRRSVGFLARDAADRSGEYSGDCRRLGFLQGVAA